MTKKKTEQLISMLNLALARSNAFINKDASPAFIVGCLQEYIKTAIQHVEDGKHKN